MASANLPMPHLGPQARRMLERIVTSGITGLPRGVLTDWVLERLYEVRYVADHPDDEAKVIPTLAGRIRWQMEVVADEKRSAEARRREGIRQRIAARQKALEDLQSGPAIALPYVPPEPKPRQPGLGGQRAGSPPGSPRALPGAPQPRQGLPSPLRRPSSTATEPPPDDAPPRHRLAPPVPDSSTPPPAGTEPPLRPDMAGREGPGIPIPPRPLPPTPELPPDRTEDAPAARRTPSPDRTEEPLAARRAPLPDRTEDLPAARRTTSPSLAEAAAAALARNAVPMRPPPDAAPPPPTAAPPPRTEDDRPASDPSSPAQPEKPPLARTTPLRDESEAPPPSPEAPPPAAMERATPAAASTPEGNEGRLPARRSSPPSLLEMPAFPAATLPPEQAGDSAPAGRLPPRRRRLGRYGVAGLGAAAALVGIMAFARSGHWPLGTPAPDQQAIAAAPHDAGSGPRLVADTVTQPAAAAAPASAAADTPASLRATPAMDTEPVRHGQPARPVGNAMPDRPPGNHAAPVGTQNQASSLTQASLPLPPPAAATPPMAAFVGSLPLPPLSPPHAAQGSQAATPTVLAAAEPRMSPPPAPAPRRHWVARKRSGHSEVERLNELSLTAAMHGRIWHPQERRGARRPN